MRSMLFNGVTFPFGNWYRDLRNRSSSRSLHLHYFFSLSFFTSGLVFPASVVFPCPGSCLDRRCC